jgi:thiol-disulfide isomerase/thioredoxin
MALALYCAGGGAGEGRSRSNREKAASAAASAPRASQSDPFADLEIQDVHGRKIDLGEFKGQVRLIDIWATWCGPCREIIPELNELYARHRDRGLVVIGLSVDELTAPVVWFQGKIPMRYPNGMFNEETAQLLGHPRAIPTTFLVDRTGVIRETFVGLVDTRTIEKAVIELL